MPLRFVNPNFHVILIHYPLGVFVLGVFLEVFSFLGWRRSSIRTAARWMIALGALATLPAGLSGIYALADVASHQGITAARYQMLRWHVIYMGAGSLLAVLCTVVGIGACDTWRKRLYWPLVLGVLISWGLMVVGAWHGGETIYQQGTSVAIITNKEDDTVTEKPQLQELKVKPHKLNDFNDVRSYYMGGVNQQHIILAGFAMALALGALGLSIRRSHAVAVEEFDQPIRGIRQDARRGSDDMTVIRSFNPEAAMALETERPPSGRFWLVTTLAALSTAAAGYWMVTGTHFFEAEGWKSFLGDMRGENDKLILNRHMAHMVLGLAFVVCSLLMALFSVAAPKKRGLAVFFGSVIVLALAAQIWMGILLQFDEEGPLFHFNKVTSVSPGGSPEAPSTAPSPSSTDQPATAPATQPTSPDTFTSAFSEKTVDSK